MATEAQTAANRRNAQNSTGPKTPAGKTRSRRNALKHGLYAESGIIPGECSDDFLELIEAYQERFDPKAKSKKVSCANSPPHNGGSTASRAWEPTSPTTPSAKKSPAGNASTTATPTMTL